MFARHVDEFGCGPRLFNPLMLPPPCRYRTLWPCPVVEVSSRTCLCGACPRKAQFSPLDQAIAPVLGS